MPTISLARLARTTRLSRGYFSASAVVLVVELFIALELDDAFIRPFVGDTLAVVLLYTALLSAFELPRRATALAALGFAFAIELGQYFQLVRWLGLGDVAWARVALGTFCDPRDFVAYTAALPLIALAERVAKASRRALRAHSGPFSRS